MIPSSVLFKFPVFSGMEKVHAFDGRETGKDGGGKMSGDYSAKCFQVLIGVLKTHLGTVERIFHIEELVVCAEIIIKNAPGSNDNIFFSVVYVSECFMFLGFRQSVRHYQYVRSGRILL